MYCFDLFISVEKGKNALLTYFTDGKVVVLFWTGGMEEWVSLDFLYFFVGFTIPGL